MSEILDPVRFVETRSIFGGPAPKVVYRGIKQHTRNLNSHLNWPQEQTVGTHIAVSHIVATPVGFDVTAKVKLIEVDGRKLVFEVEAHDGVDVISKGTHERYVINKDKFNTKMKEKTSEKLT